MHTHQSECNNNNINNSKIQEISEVAEWCSVNMITKGSKEVSEGLSSFFSNYAGKN